MSETAVALQSGSRDILAGLDARREHRASSVFTSTQNSVGPVQKKSGRLPVTQTGSASHLNPSRESSRSAAPSQSSDDALCEISPLQQSIDDAVRCNPGVFVRRLTRREENRVSVSEQRVNQFCGNFQAGTGFAWKQNILLLSVSGHIS